MKFLFFLFFSINIVGQNLLINSSFSEVVNKNDSISGYTLLPGNLSEVKDWYLPEYINYRSMQRRIDQLYAATYYYTSRDKQKNIRDKNYTNGDQLFENNLGFVRMYIYNLYPVTIIQQHLKRPLKKGKYCLRFKYKHLLAKSNSKHKVKLEFSLSATDLKEYHKDKLTVPSHLVQVEFADTLKVGDANLPWQQRCFILDLVGGEEYFSIGTLKNKKQYDLSFGQYFIDDIELYFLEENNICNCEIIDKDLMSKYFRNFPLNEVVSNDTLILFTPHNNWSPDIITPPTKEYLNSLIAFMQRNPSLNIKWIELDQFNNLNSRPIHFEHFVRYLEFYGISIERMSVENGICTDLTGKYCGSSAEYIKIGFQFYVGL